MYHGAAVSCEAAVVSDRVRSDREPGSTRQTSSVHDLHAFGYLFPELQEDGENLLPVSNCTRAGLVRLGRSMRDPGDARSPGVSRVPAAYTYFGQFVAHDMTLESVSAHLPDLLSRAIKPLALEKIRDTIRNLRTATLDLDSLYDPPAPRNGDRMVLGSVSKLHKPLFPQERPFLRSIQGGQSTDESYDVPREPPSSDPLHDRAALIGDPRNDETVILSQLHLAFLRAHNALVAQGLGFAQAQKVLRQHYQHVVVHDFLKRVSTLPVVDVLLQNGNHVYDPQPEKFFLPFELTAAAFRFGHSMVRNDYDINGNFRLSSGDEPSTAPATLGSLFTLAALNGEMPGVIPRCRFGTLPENWIIEWKYLIDANVGTPFSQARRIDTKLVEPGLFRLPNPEGKTERGDGARLAVRNLLRGYLLRMPTGQAVAYALGHTPLTPVEIGTAAASPEQVAALEAGGFLERTPLWYYVLAEASHGGGQRLGPVGSILVADVLIGLVRRSKDSILSDPDWTGPTLPSGRPGVFTLSDLLRFADVLT